MTKKKKRNKNMTKGTNHHQAAHRANSGSPDIRNEQASNETSLAINEQNPARKRAAHALEMINTLLEEAKTQGADKVYGNYVAFVSALPAKIIMNGLGQALAMEQASGRSTTSKGNNSDGGDRDQGVNTTQAGHHKLYQHINAWLAEAWDGPYRDKGDCLEAIVEGTEADYLLAQEEVLGYLAWLKKFAVALLARVNEGSNAKEVRDDAATR